MNRLIAFTFAITLAAPAPSEAVEARSTGETREALPGFVIAWDNSDQVYRQRLWEQRTYDNWQRDLESTRPPPYRPPANCTSNRVGDMVFTSCY